MTAQLNAEYWSQRYTQGETGWDLGAVSTPLKTYFDQLENKDLRILIPGAGNAYEAEYLLQLGFRDVTVCDFSPLPLRNLESRVKNNPALKTIEMDFFLLGGQYDLVVEQTFFCAISPKLRKKYFLKMQELLMKGGKLVGLLFDDTLNNDKPPFGGSREEYLKYIPTALEVVKFERCYNSIAPRTGREIFMILRKTN